VELAEPSDRDGAAVFSEANCIWCHAADGGAFKVQVPASVADVEACLTEFAGRDDRRWRAAIAFGIRGITAGNTAHSLMPSHYRELSLAEVDAVIGYIRGLEHVAEVYRFDDESDE
jgi:mono/diheme cytochrome c family protein